MRLSNQWTTLGSCLVFFALAVLTALRGQRNPVARPLGLMFLDLAAYNTLELVGDVTGDPVLNWPESAAAALAAPLTLHFLAAFVGARRSLAWLLRGAYGVFGAIAAASLSPFVFPELTDFPGGPVWAQLMLGALLPSFGLGAVHLVRYLRTTLSTEERARTQLVVLAMTLGVGGVVTDLASIAGTNVPRLSPFGMAVGAFLLAAVALRFRLFGSVRALDLASALVLAALAVLAQLVVHRLLGGRETLLMLGTIVVALSVVAVVRQVTSTRASHRARTHELATLGRLSAQMAHDVRNPVAAIRGAAQLLQTELDAGRVIDAQQRAFLDLIVVQADRVERVVSGYQRLGRVSPSVASVDLAELARDVVAAQRNAMPATLAVTLEAQPTPVQADADLVARVLENLLRNAWEAMPDGGNVTVRVGPAGTMARLDVDDDGPGMDARTREQAFDDLFTTKATGSGLGLAFVRRVAEAHGGRAQLVARAGRGVCVRVELPRT